jgi:hypothetical protein
MVDPFRSAHLKIDRAKHHIEDLRRGVVGINTKDSYEVVIKADPQPGYNVHKFRLRRPIPFDWFSVVYGDAVSNLRAALDHAVYACAVIDGHIDPKFRACSFPFASNETFFNKELDKRVAIPKEIKTLLGTFCAYEAGHFGLWALNEMCNRDKHALITPVLMGFDHISVHVHADNEAAVEPPANPLWDSVKNQIDLFRTKGDPKYDFAVSLNIAFDRPRGIAGHPVDAMLYGFLAIVESIVATIKDEARRIRPSAFVLS